MSDDDAPGHRSWAHLRFSIIGPLLASPPASGQLQQTLDALATKRWRHPTQSDVWLTFGRSTIEKWYYLARDADDPIAALSRKVRKDAGATRVMTDTLITALGLQHKAHRGWTYQLHHDNLVALIQEQATHAKAPSYSTVRRFMKARGWSPKKSGRKLRPGQIRAAEHLEQVEVRSFERPDAHALWHWDFHVGSLQVVDSKGRWHTPVAIGVLDDCSRLCCHMQWFHTESAHTTYLGLRQALLKWGLPREAMSDNGKAMLASETQQGLQRLGIIHSTTLPYSPYQNGKQEAFWGPVEGRLLAMLEGVDGLTLEFLNRATLAWVELEYNRKRHSELGMSPIERMQQVADRSRTAPSADAIDRAFTARVHRTIRRSDTTITMDAIRYELPSRLRNMGHVTVRIARWDRACAWVVDPKTDAVLAVIRPQDKHKNADGKRRVLEPDEAGHTPIDTDADPLPPLMRRLLNDYAATGLPPAYIPFDPWSDDDA